MGTGFLSWKNTGRGEENKIMIIRHAGRIALAKKVRITKISIEATHVSNHRVDRFCESLAPMNMH